MQSAIGWESQKTRIRLFATTFEVKGVGASAVPRGCHPLPLLISGKGFSFVRTPQSGAFFFGVGRSPFGKKDSVDHRFLAEAAPMPPVAGVGARAAIKSVIY